MFFLIKARVGSTLFKDRFCVQLRTYPVFSGINAMALSVANFRWQTTTRLIGINALSPNLQNQAKAESQNKS